jgi:hypothetical protein
MMMYVLRVKLLRSTESGTTALSNAPFAPGLDAEGEAEGEVDGKLPDEVDCDDPYDPGVGEDPDEVDELLVDEVPLLCKASAWKSAKDRFEFGSALTANTIPCWQ